MRKEEKTTLHLKIDNMSEKKEKKRKMIHSNFNFDSDSVGRVESA